MLKSFFSVLKKPSFFVPLVVCIIVFYSFSPTLKNDFVVWDDDVHLLENLSIRSLDQEHLIEMFTSKVNGIYIPLSLLSFAIEYHFFGYEPFIYHLDNLILHLLVVLFVYFTALRLGLSVAGGAIAALVFGIHPIHVESVAWVTERKDVLYAFFYMAAILSYIRYLNISKNKKESQRSPRYSFLVLTFLLSMLSILAKPMAISLPLILLLIDWFYRRKIGYRALLEKLFIGLPMAGIAWITYATHAEAPQYNLVQGILLWSWTFVFYVRQFVFPILLVPIYKVPSPPSFTQFDFSMSFIIVMLFVFAVIRFRKYRWFLFAVLYYFLSIFFLLRFDQTSVYWGPNEVADRFMYLPCLGFCILVGAGWEKMFQAEAKPFKGLAVLCLIVFSAFFVHKTYQQCKLWKNAITLWQHELRYFPNDPFALNNLAAGLRKRDDVKLATEEFQKINQIISEGLEVKYSPEIVRYIQRVNQVVHLYKKAIQNNPEFVPSYYNLGEFYHTLGMIPEAIDFYTQAIRVNPNYQDTYYSLGRLYQDIGKVNKAIEAFTQNLSINAKDEDAYINVILAYNQALVRDPDNQQYQEARQKAINGFTQLINSSTTNRATSFYNLGYLYTEMGDLTRAISAYEMALDINTNHSNALYNLATIYKDLGRLNEALAMYQRVIKVDRRNSNAYLNIGIIFGRQGKIKDSQEYYARAIQADPENVKGYFNLAYTYEVTHQPRKAVQYYKKAIALDSRFVEAYYNLGNVYMALGDTQKAKASYLETVRINPNHMNAWVNLSVDAYKEDDYDQAVKYLEEAMLVGYEPPREYLEALGLDN